MPTPIAAMVGPNIPEPKYLLAAEHGPIKFFSHGRHTALARGLVSQGIFTKSGMKSINIQYKILMMVNTNQAHFSNFHLFWAVSIDNDHKTKKMRGVIIMRGSKINACLLSYTIFTVKAICVGPPRAIELIL